MKKLLELNLDYSKVTKQDRKEFENNILRIHKMIQNKTGEGNEFMDWLSWPVDYDKKELDNIISKINLMNEMGIEKLLVIGIGGSYLGGQSAIDLIKGKINMQDKVIFAGINMSSSHIRQIEKQLEGFNWAICAISKSGTTLEPALSFRYFKKILENKLGKELLKHYIIIITDEKKGTLKKLADKKGYTTYVVPNGIGGRFSGITPVGLFPIAFAGIDIKSILKGSEKAMKDFSKEKNDAYDYALTRFILNTKKEKLIEIFTTYDFDLGLTSEWIKQLFGESEGKDGKGIIPSSVSYSTDLHSLGQIIQEGPQRFFETTIWIDNDQNNIFVENDEENFDELNYLVGKNFHEINFNAFNGVLKAHYEGGGTPNIIIKIKDNSEETLGYLWYFFFISVTMSAYLLEVNPFNQPGVDLYKKNMFKNLKN